MFSRLRTISFLLLLYPSLLWAAHSVSYNIQLRNNSLSSSINVYIESLREILSVVRDGVTFKLLIEVEVYEDRTGLFEGNRRLFRRLIQREISYDSISAQYIVIDSSRRFHFNSSSKLTAFLLNLKLNNIVQDLEEGNTYLMRVRVQGKTIELYFPMSLVMQLFANVHNFDTGWQSKEFELQ